MGVGVERAQVGLHGGEMCMRVEWGRGELFFFFGSHEVVGFGFWVLGSERVSAFS